MLHRRKQVGYLAMNLAGIGIGRNEIGIGFLQRSQLAGQRIKLIIFNFGCVVVIVPFAVVVDELVEFRHTLAGLLLIHVVCLPVLILLV